jgi:uncharacterized protein (DUF1778 family)
VEYTYNGPGVYRLTIGNHKYIGSSKNVASRLKSHLTAAQGGREPVRLQKAYDEAGEIRSEVLLRLPWDTTRIEMLQKEKEWIMRERPDLNDAPVPARNEKDIIGMIKYAARERWLAGSATSEYERKRHEKWAHMYTCLVEDFKEKYLEPLGGEEMPGNKEAVKKYQAGRDAIMLRPESKVGAAIREAARASSTSVQAFVLDAVAKKMEPMPEPEPAPLPTVENVELGDEAIAKAMEAAELSGESLRDFLDRAINDTAKRDEFARLLKR